MRALKNKEFEGQYYCIPAEINVESPGLFRQHGPAREDGQDPARRLGREQRPQELG